MYVYAIIRHYFSHFDKGKVLQREYSQPPILPSPHFRLVVDIYTKYLLFISLWLLFRLPLESGLNLLEAVWWESGLRGSDVVNTMSACNQT